VVVPGTADVDDAVDGAAVDRSSGNTAAGAARSVASVQRSVMPKCSS